MLLLLPVTFLSLFIATSKVQAALRHSRRSTGPEPEGRCTSGCRPVLAALGPVPVSAHAWWGLPPGPPVSCQQQQSCPRQPGLPSAGGSSLGAAAVACPGTESKPLPTKHARYAGYQWVIYGEHVGTSEEACLFVAKAFLTSDCHQISLSVLILGAYGPLPFCNKQIEGDFCFLLLCECASYSNGYLQSLCKDIFLSWV